MAHRKGKLAAKAKVGPGQRGSTGGPPSKSFAVGTKVAALKFFAGSSSVVSFFLRRAACFEKKNETERTAHLKAPPIADAALLSFFYRVFRLVFTTGFSCPNSEKKIGSVRKCFFFLPKS